MLSIFSWSSVCLLWENVCLGLLPTFWLCWFLFFNCLSCLCILEIKPLFNCKHCLQLFSPILWLSFCCVYGFLSVQKLKSFIKFHLFIFTLMAPHSSVLAWRIPGMVEPGGLPSMGSHRVGHDWSDLAAADSICLFSLLFLFPGRLT